MFPGGNIKISDVLQISPRLRGIPLGLRYQGISSYINLSGFFSSKQNGSGWAQKIIDESLPATAPTAHSGFSKGRLGLDVMIIIILTSVYNFSMVRRWRSGKIVRLST